MSWIIQNRARSIVIAVGLALFGLQALAHAATKVAVIDESAGSGSGAAWCALLTGNGHDCTVFPATGPSGPLDSFQVLINLSDTWSDPAHILADFLRARKGVILWGGAAYALGVETDPIVQAYVGATEIAGGSGILLTVASDGIFGAIAPGTQICNCGDCCYSALWIGSILPAANVLARWENGTTDVGVLRNTWEGGQTIFLTSEFGLSSPLHQEIILNSVAELTHPIPAASSWMVLLMLLGLLCGGTIILRQTKSAAHPSPGKGKGGQAPFIDDIILNIFRILSRPIPATSTWGVGLVILGILSRGTVMLRLKNTQSRASGLFLSNWHLVSLLPLGSAKLAEKQSLSTILS